MLDELGKRPLAWAEFERLLPKLLVDTNDPELKVGEHKDSRFPNAYLCEFDRALVVFQILRDYRVAEFLQVT